jgi:hypothetical protein
MLVECGMSHHIVFLVVALGLLAHGTEVHVPSMLVLAYPYGVTTPSQTRLTHHFSKESVCCRYIRTSKTESGF